MHSVTSRIMTFNQGRIPELLNMKYDAMRENPFRFFRGTCHLFYEDLPARSPLLKSPLTWVCGDLHLENFGSFKADNHIPYFDINDFDESVLAPCLVDPTRLLCSVLLASDVLGINKKGAKKLFDTFLDTYANTLATGYIRSLEKQAATGTIKLFLDTVRNRKHKPFIMKRMEMRNGKPRLIIDKIKTLKAPKESKTQIKEQVQAWMSQHPQTKGYKILDIAYRIAGTGSLGGTRYALLVTHADMPGEHYLLDLKLALPSCILNYHSFSQPEWPDEASRVTEVQKRFQAASPALLHEVEAGNQHYILKVLQPSADKIDFQSFNGKTKKLEEILYCMAQICAWDCLRSGGRQGSAIADELIDFAAKAPKWKEAVFEYASSYAVQVTKDFKAYAADYDAGKVKA